MSATQLSFFQSESLGPPSLKSRLDSFVIRLLSVLFVLDDSGSMEGEPITAVNYAMGELPPILKAKMERELAGIELRIQVIRFASSAKALYPEPVTLDEWNHLPLTAGGGTDYGKAYHVLDEELRRLGTRQSVAPCVILVSDGYPGKDPTPAFQQLLQNPLAAHAVRAAVAVGELADRAQLSAFLSRGQKLREVNDPEDIAEAIIASTLASIEQASTPVTQSPYGSDIEPPRSASRPLVSDDALSPEQLQAIRDAGIDPDQLVS